MFQINPAIATISNKLVSGDTFSDQGAQLNLRVDYKIHDRVSLRFHPQYANWKSDKLGSTLKMEFSATVDLSQDKRHKLSLVHEAFVVNNEASGGKTRWVGEDSPIAGYVPGTEATYKIRYAYVF